jgi:hypothetical protein
MPRPLALIDEQMTTVFRMAAPLANDMRGYFFEDVANDMRGYFLEDVANDMRGYFLEDVARLLAGLPEIGDGAVARICAEVQQRYWRACETRSSEELSASTIRRSSVTTLSTSAWVSIPNGPPQG